MTFNGGEERPDRPGSALAAAVGPASNSSAWNGSVADGSGKATEHRVGVATHAVVRVLHFGAVAAPGPSGRGVGRAADHGAGAAMRFGFDVDVDSAQAWPDVPYDTAAAQAQPDAAMRARIEGALDAAAQTMASRVPAAFALVNAQLQRVLLRRSDGQPGTSTSHRAHVGSCLLTNLHQPAFDVAVQVAVEALTHEAIHQLLYRTEHAEGLFCDLAPTPTFRSPWSGARLPLHSLVHASFVWFGLLTLWNALAQAPASQGDGADEAAHARARVAHCLFGFAFLDDLLDSPAFPVASVSPPVLQALRGLAATARQATKAAEPAGTLREAAAVRRQAGWPAALGAALGTPPAATDLQATATTPCRHGAA